MKHNFLVTFVDAQEYFDFSSGVLWACVEQGIFNVMPFQRRVFIVVPVLPDFACLATC